jgi:Ca2+-binding RTX toxin-like protein
VNVVATPGAASTFAAFSGDCVGATCSVTMTAPRSVTATFNAVTFALTVDIQGTGTGVVTSTSGPGIACAGNAGVDGGDCSESYAQNTNVTLQATAGSGSTFVGSWGGACAAFGTNPTCVVSMTAAQAVTASFTLLGGGGAGACTITGTAGADVLNGTAGPDVICGKGGNDVINGKGGADTLKGDKGADVISGGGGPDKLFGGKGADVLKGGTGADTANGGPGIDVCKAEVKISCP